MSEPVRKKKRIAIAGAGGFAREVAWLVHSINEMTPIYEMVGYVVSQMSALKETDSREGILGDIEWLAGHRERVDCLALGIGTPGVRESISKALCAAAPDAEWPVLVHPTARYDSESCTLGRGAVMCAGAIATVNVDIGEFAMVNLSCTVGHETRIGRCSVLNPSANISGGVTIGDSVLIGTGAVILQYRKIGDRATVGAGAVVTRDVAAGITVVGVPARPMRRG